MTELQKQFEAETKLASWVNDEFYLKGKVYTSAYVEWLEAKLNKHDVLLNAVAHQKIDLIKEYLEPTLKITELMDRNAFSSLCHLLDAYLLEAVRNSR